MMKMIINTLCMLLLLVPMSMAEAIVFTEVTTQQEWEEALSKAKANDQLIFVDVYATWCGYCKKMDREVYSQERIGEFYNAKFVNIRLDGEAGIGPEIVKRYEITGFPELLFINAANELISKGVGYIEIEGFYQLGEQAIASWKRLPALQKTLALGNISMEDAIELASLLKAKGNEKEAMATAVKALEKKKLKDLMPYHAWTLISKYAHGLGNPLLQQVVENREKFIYMRGAAAVDEYIQSCVTSNLAAAVHDEDEAMMQRIVTELVPLLDYGTSESDRKQMVGITKTMFYQKTENWEKYAKSVDEYLAANPTDEDFALSQSKEVLQLGVSSLNEAALRWCKMVIDRHPEGKFEAEAFYAISLARMGKKEEAKNMVTAMQERYADDEEKKVLSQELMQYISQQ